ncbi:hypothetical protein [Aulosira sp. FACHB-615]|uniref:hypothetical protein n=1 Tax=Aulosira sp. FACHB-615 TaxID=2692777 RepID=UPI0016862354|nr:hypothetical protein [Aulosira sp. FACHB-615]MBD2491144.1 hypothetical protein [Aulosira sp. FACHB-615]
MSGKGGRTSTSWETGSSWRSGKTKLIRVPEAIADEVMRCARTIDAGIAVLHGNSANEQEIILSAIAKYIGYKNTHYHANQHSKTLDISTRAWDELRRFRGMVAQEPEKLGLKGK